MTDGWTIPEEQRRPILARLGAELVLQRALRQLNAAGPRYWETAPAA